MIAILGALFLLLFVFALLYIDHYREKKSKMKHAH